LMTATRRLLTQARLVLLTFPEKSGNPSLRVTVVAVSDRAVEDPVMLAEAGVAATAATPLRQAMSVTEAAAFAGFVRPPGPRVLELNIGILSFARTYQLLDTGEDPLNRR
jgi:hypothetical protein